MEYRRLGKSGLKVSTLSFGTWVTFGAQIDDETAERLMVTAYDGGVNFFDNAEVYANGKSEIVMGKILKKMNWDRSSYLVSSKVFFGWKGYGSDNIKPNQYGLNRKHVIEACDEALQRLNVDYLDLYFCHRPDKETPIEETVRAMTDLIRMGKVLYWGTSEWSAQEIMEAYSVARQYGLVPPTMEQPQYNMFHREKVENDFLKLYREIGLGTTIWSPLASGLLTGKYLDADPGDTRLAMENMQWLRDRLLGEGAEAMMERVRKLKKVADELGTNLARLSLAWCMKNPNVSTVITGASKIEHLKDNLKAFEVVEILQDDVMEEIEGILENKPKLPQF